MSKRHQANLDAIAYAMELPSISAAFNKRLNAAAKAGEQDAIQRESRPD